ncbi:MAG TPA: divalent-cation tolerance protein CutA [Alphaproteobacteria bacterium]|jgi:periplasmic divalent cation tolerance protein
MSEPENREAAIMMAYVTASSRAEALTLGRALVEERLAACANVFEGATSIYRWGDKLQEEAEAILILKTRAELIEALTARLRDLHSYDLPCVVAWRIDGGNPPYLDWVRAETVR